MNSVSVDFDGASQGLGLAARYDEATGLELVDAYTRDGRPLGFERARGTRDDAHGYGKICEALILHRDGSILTMRRALSKDTYAGLWEASAGGGLRAGESEVEGLRREIFEETGLMLAAQDLAFDHHVAYTDHKTIFCGYICVLDCDKNAVRLQDGETIDYAWRTPAEFVQLLRSGEAMPGQACRFVHYYFRQGWIG